MNYQIIKSKEISTEKRELGMDKVKNKGITSSQIEARSSADRSLALSISIIESKGLGSKGVNPEANLEVLKTPSEPHFTKSPGIDSSCGF